MADISQLSKNLPVRYYHQYLETQVRPEESEFWKKRGGIVDSLYKGNMLSQSVEGLAQS